MNFTFERWTATKSAELYGVDDWGAGYFKVDDAGDLMVMPYPGETGSAVRIRDIVDGIKERGLDMPVLLRIENILNSRISDLNDSFLSAIADLDYKGSFVGAYPIKVNQQEQVVEKITQFGSKYHHGLEAGSKAELIAAMAMLRDKEAPLICNGYKDEEFIDLGLYASKIGLFCILVVEMPSEIPLIIARAKALNARPVLGIRIKLTSQAGGHWSDSGGDRSIFGLNATQIVEMVDLLKQEDMLDCLQLVHYHLGSQISNIRDIRIAVNEACRVFAGIYNEGANLRFLDLGGGLAVDYDGSQSNYLSSRNYSLNEYCVDIVEGVMTTLDEAGIPHPDIITESGRSLVAYYSMLLFNVLDVTRFRTDSITEPLPAGCHPQIRYMHEAMTGLTFRNVQECFNDILFYREELRNLFNHGKISLRERSLAEQIFWATMTEISKKAKEIKNVAPEIEDIDRALADIYYCNFSVFQSLPDAWAIEQLFPVMPIHRLDEHPDRSAILADITCDCDGKIDRFIDSHGFRRYLPVHTLKDSEEYYLGVFLVGAYQETLGDLHNLLGDTNVVTVRLLANGEFEYVNEQEGDTVSDMLSYVAYDTKRLMTRFRETAEKAVRQGLISASERREIKQAYEAGMRGYTYFER
ncbi:MAG TPA: arginine decarboxylase [Desulfobacteraceae bacterium]|nr:arginine decarboxylase [Desulfobacteraceae bacterium]